jgi:predicted Fe-S protein YdhL (DUF1289 family)
LCRFWSLPVASLFIRHNQVESVKVCIKSEREKKEEAEWSSAEEGERDGFGIEIVGDSIYNSL